MITKDHKQEKSILLSMDSWLTAGIFDRKTNMSNKENKNLIDYSHYSTLHCANYNTVYLHYGTKATSKFYSANATYIALLLYYYLHSSHYLITLTLCYTCT